MTDFLVLNIIITFFIVFAFGIMLSYLILALLSYMEIRKYIHAFGYVKSNLLLSSPIVPRVSILAPAYNEALNIVANVRSLLSLQYTDMELVIINDGSKDNSMDLLIEAYKLEKTSFYPYEYVSCKKIKGVYRSVHPSFSRLVVVDKENGGKSDALNAGINVSSGKLFACIDVDCILEPNSIIKMVIPFIRERSKKIIATGGVIRIANDCVFKGGRLQKVRLPNSWICRWQVLEYMRSFLLGRMGWARVNGLLLISGAFGLFNRKLAIEAGGYRHDTVGEDMELVVRMRRIMEEKRIPYAVKFIPDPLCWTEAPSSWKILGRQRNRWTRGTMDTLKFHRKMLFNPRYRFTGMVSFPYWLFFEWLAPIIEFLGIIITILLLVLGYVNVKFLILTIILVYSFAVMISMYALWTDQRTYMQYKDRGDQWRLILAAFLEPFIYHPFLVWSALKGNIDYFSGKKSWGTMTRRGIAKNG